jgi:hypothetical protein
VDNQKDISNFHRQKTIYGHFYKKLIFEILFHTGIGEGASGEKVCQKKD